MVQLALVQQSEYLRRFALAFSDKVREEKSLDQSGVLEQIKGMVGTIKKINHKLSQVFDYHQAMGVVPEKRQRALLTKRNRLDLVPLRTVYTSLFSTGLHLQNSLLKIRQLENQFDQIEKKKTKDTDMFSALLPSSSG